MKLVVYTVSDSQDNPVSAPRPVIYISVRLGGQEFARRRKPMFGPLTTRQREMEWRTNRGAFHITDQRLYEMAKVAGLC